MDNAKIITELLTTLFVKISRRTNEKNAITILNRVLSDSKNKYSYLTLIIINDATYKENRDYIKINNEKLFNKLSSKNLKNCIKDIFELTIKHLQRDADYFFIREFKEAVNKIDDFHLDYNELDLNKLQFKYIINRKEDLKIKNSKIFKIIIEAFLNTINKLSNNLESYSIIKSIFNSSYNQFEFLKAIEFKNEKNQKSYYDISIDPSIDYIPSYQISKAIVYLIRQIGYKIDTENKSIYIDTLKKEINNENLLLLKKIGVNLNLIDISIFKVGFDNVLNKILSTIYFLLLKEKSKENIKLKMNEVISSLKQNYEFLDNIKIKEISLENNDNIFEINPEINNVPAYKYAKALREIIIETSNYFSKDKSIFIDEFKQSIGDEYLYEIEKIGVNLHFLEMKFLISK